MMNITEDNSSQDACKLQGLDKFSKDFQGPYGIITLCIAIAGICFNILNIIVLMHPKMRNAVNLLLKVLSCFELALFVMYIPFIVLFNLAFPEDVPHFHTTSKATAYYLLVYADLSVFFHTTCLWLIIITACFRFLYVKFPIKSTKWCSYRRAVIAASVTILAALSVCTPNMVRNAVRDVPDIKNLTCFNIDNNATYYSVVVSKYFERNGWEIFNYWLVATVGKFIPVMFLLVLTVLLVCILRQARKRHDRLHQGGKDHKDQRSGQTTRMLLAVVILFFLAELPHGVLIVNSAFVGDEKLYNQLGDVIDLFTLLAFAINFVLYSTMSRQYRMLFLELVQKPFGGKKQYSAVPQKPDNKTKQTERLAVNKQNPAPHSETLISKLHSENGGQHNT